MRSAREKAEQGGRVQMTGKLPENIAYFARALRIAGVPVGAGAVVEAVEALADGALGAARGRLLGAACDLREAA